MPDHVGLRPEGAHRGAYVADFNRELPLVNEQSHYGLEKLRQTHLDGDRHRQDLHDDEGTARQDGADELATTLPLLAGSTFRDALNRNLDTQIITPTSSLRKRTMSADIRRSASCSSSQFILLATPPNWARSEPTRSIEIEFG